MTERCGELDLFFDGELSSAAAQAFRDHLAGCARCQDALRGRMLEAAVLADHAVAAVDAAPVPPILNDASAERDDRLPGAAVIAIQRPRGWARPSRLVAIAALTAAAAGVMLWSRPPDPPAPAGAGGAVAALDPASPDPMAPPIDLARSLAPERGVEVRFSAPALDRHRRFAVVRAAGPAPTEQIEMRDLLVLQQHGELNALVGAHAMIGSLTLAKRIATTLPRTAASLVDRAALELLIADGGSEPTGKPVQEVAAQLALSLTTEALRLEPGNPQAKWNQALALRRLGLARVAAGMFDEVAARREQGWAEEARANAQHLRDDQDRAARDWAQLQARADRMVLGGPVLSDDDAAAAASLARDAFYKALATAASPARLAELAPLARALDTRFATTLLGDLLARVRRSDLRVRAPLAAELAAFIDATARHVKPAIKIDDLRARAMQVDLRDLVLASFLAVEDRATGDRQLPLLDRLVERNPDLWWSLVALARHAFVAQFIHGDLPAVDAIARRAAPICKALHTMWCVRIAVFAGDANSQMGRAELAIEQLTAARKQAVEAAAWNDEVQTLHALGQAISSRVTGELDASAIGDAYLTEVALRKTTCEPRLEQLDYFADAELRHHRFAEAASAVRKIDALGRDECRTAGPSLNTANTRLQLLLHGLSDLETMRANIALLAAEDQPYDRTLDFDLLRAGALLAEDPARGEPAMRQVIAAATADPTRPHATDVRALGFNALVESVASGGDAGAVLALLTDRVGAPKFERCVLGVASWNRRVVAVRGATGAAALEIAELPAGVVMTPPPLVVSPEMRARLAGCPRVEVMAPAPYFGSPKLLGDDVAWVYHTGMPHPARPLDFDAELVVTDVAPPEDLHLPRLQSFAGRAPARVLAGTHATPDRVLAAMQSAGLVTIVAHGLTDANEPAAASLVLSPDDRGEYLLTASKVSAGKLANSPIVILAGCDAGRVQVSAEPWSLATSLLHAGARIVIAPTEPIPDASAGEVFQSLVERIRTGADPVDALAAERRARGADAAWLSSIVVFE